MQGTKRFSIPQYEHQKVYYGASPRKNSKKIRQVKVSRIKTKQVKNWLDIHKEMLRWQKTDEFVRWRKKQFLKQGGTCYYCDNLLVGRKQNIEHIIPKYKGGDNRKSNLAIACAACNKEKNTTLLSYKERTLLKEKNRKKRGTYHRVQDLYRTEEAIALDLRRILNED